MDLYSYASLARSAKHLFVPLAREKTLSDPSFDLAPFLKRGSWG
jgi:hypothetical protein